MSLEITNVQNFLVKDSNPLKLLLVALGFGSQTFICGFSRQNICSVVLALEWKSLDNYWTKLGDSGHLGIIKFNDPRNESDIALTQTLVVPFSSIEICQTYFQIECKGR